MRLILAFIVSVCILSGCLLESIPQLPKYRAPYGAYYVKPGMTREGRVQDMTACGSRDGLGGNFTKEQIEKATIPKDKAAPGQITGGIFILIKNLESCMESKGYHFLPPNEAGECEGDQNYFPKCMWP